MSSGSFPADPAQRKVVLVLQQHDLEKCSYEPGAAKALLDDEAYVLQFPVRTGDDAPLALRNIMDAGLARPGNILVQNPFDPQVYEDAAVASQRFALAKHMLFSAFCRHLGAREVRVEQIELRTRSGKSSLDLKAERAGATGQVTVEQEELERFRAQMSLVDEFAGGSVDAAEAEQLLRRTGLWADSNMRTLLEMRQGGSNELRTRKLVLSLSSEARSNLSVAGRLKVPGFIKLSADYDRVVREQHDYTLTVTVRF